MIAVVPGIVSPSAPYCNCFIIHMHRLQDSASPLHVTCARVMPAIMYQLHAMPHIHRDILRFFLVLEITEFVKSFQRSN